MPRIENGQVYRQRIQRLRHIKVAHTDIKIKRNGYFDNDDHGLIPWDEPIEYRPRSNHPDGGCYGIRCIGENFRVWLEAAPVSINPNSSLAGAWTGKVPGLGGWRLEDRATHLAERHRFYNIVQNGIGAMNHMGPDMRIGLELGWGGFLCKIRKYRTFNRPSDTAFYDGEENLVLGVQAWIRRHIEKAREMAAGEPDRTARDNLRDIAEMNEWLVDGPPRTLREACQFFAWFQSIDRMYATSGALDQLDELLRPYYEAEIRSLSAAETAAYENSVVWHLASLFFNDTHYSQVGGPAPDGHDRTSRVSFLILEAAHLLTIPSNIAVRVHEKIDPKLLRRAVEIILEDGTGPSFSCAGGLDKGFARNGFPMGLARMRAKVGCNWTALPGIEYSLQDVTRICLVAPFIHAFDELAAEPVADRTMEALWDRYLAHLTAADRLIKEGFDWHMEHQSENAPEIVLNLFCHGPIERGLDVAEGGVDIVNLCVDGVGLATVADSFAALEQRVVKEGRLSWEDLKRLLDADYPDDNVRLMMKSIPRYGSGASRADFWARRIAAAFTSIVKAARTPLGGYNVIPGLFSHGIVRALGRDLPATPNGRRAGDPIAHSADPDPGFSRNWGSAPTMKANAVAAVQPGWGNSAPLQIDLDRAFVRNAGGIDAIIALIKAHDEAGGTLINLNVVSKEQILEADKDPDRFPDLVVRVTGYSGYFKSLSPDYRKQVVERILAEG